MDICKKYLYNDWHQCIRTEVIRGKEEEAERVVLENIYDGEGLRYSVIENGRRTDFVTNGWENLAELDENGKVTKRILRGNGIVASEDTEGKTYAWQDIAGATGVLNTAYHYYHGNERMDVEYITDEAGRVVNSYEYDAFGSITSSTEKLQNRYNYNGEVYDKTTEQYYLRKRFYNPKLCCFTQEDEYRGDGLNLYEFCANNPVMYVDPSGYKGKATGSSGNSGTTMSWNEFQNANSNKGYTNQEMSDAWSQYKMDNGIGEHYLHRPYIRKKTKNGIEGNKATDAISGEAIQYQADIGHKYGDEFWRCRDAAEALGWTQSQFNDYMNQSSLYQYEEHSENIKHDRENKNRDISEKMEEMKAWEENKKCKTGG